MGAENRVNKKKFLVIVICSTNPLRLWDKHLSQEAMNSRQTQRQIQEVN
jgi:hypothetical protein